MATKKNEIAKNESVSALVVADRPDWLDPSQSRGSEEVGIDDITLPRIDVLQALSPQIKKTDPKYIEGAEQGMVFNTVSSELYGSQVSFIPVKFAREFIVWQDRKAGGGFRGSFQSEEDAERERLQLESPDSHEVVETHVHYVLIVHDDGSVEEAVLSLSRSKRKVSRKINTLVQMAGCDRFAKVYSLNAIEVDGPKGEYWSFDVTPLGWATKPHYDKALATFEAINNGERKIDRNYSEDGAEGRPASAEV